jgi:hypothetical protein
VYRPVYRVFYTVTDDFVSDHWTPEFEEGVLLPLVSLGHWRLATTREQLGQRKDSLDKLSIPGDRDGSPLPPITATSASESSTKLRHSTVAGKVDTALQPSIPPAGPTRDTPKIPADSKPCDYFRTKITDLLDRKILRQSTEQRLGPMPPFFSIAAVVRALNEISPVGYGFTIWDGVDRGFTSRGNDDFTHHDRVVLRHIELHNHNIILLLYQFGVGVSDVHSTIHVFDSGHGILSAEQRAELWGIILSTSDTFDTQFPSSLT